MNTSDAPVAQVFAIMPIPIMSPKHARVAIQKVLSSAGSSVSALNGFPLTNVPTNTNFRTKNIEVGCVEFEPNVGYTDFLQERYKFEGGFMFSPSEMVLSAAAAIFEARIASVSSKGKRAAKKMGFTDPFEDDFTPIVGVHPIETEGEKVVFSFGYHQAQRPFFGMSAESHLQRCPRGVYRILVHRFV